MCCVFVLSYFSPMYADCGSNHDFNTTNFCMDNEMVVLKSDCTCELWMNSVLFFEGSWEFEDDNHVRITITDDEGTSETFRCEIQYRRVITRGSGTILSINYHTLVFNDHEYTKCD